RPFSQVFPISVLVSATIWLAGLGLVLSLDDPRLRFLQYAAGMALAGLGWLGLIRAASRGHFGVGRPTDTPAQHRAMFLVVLLGLGIRIVALTFTPAFSEDVFRYVYEGRAVLYYGWTFPFAHAPADAPQFGVDPTLLDHAWLRINHPELSTIYPPFSQVTFVVAAAIAESIGDHHLLWLKALLVVADLVVWVLLTLALRAQRRPAAEAFVWALCPLVILEVAREGHADSLSAIGLSLGIWGFVVALPYVGYAGYALAAVAKLNGLFALPAAVRTVRRGLPVALIICSFVLLPYLFSGGSAGGGISAYAQRWRAGDGAFSVILFISEYLLGGDWVRIDLWWPLPDFTVTRHQLARALTGAAYLAWMFMVLNHSAPVRRIPARAGLLLLGLLLLSPTLHPWYVLWLLPFAAAAPRFSGRYAVIVLALLVPALHHPGWLELVDGEWREIGWVRAMVHLPVWIVLTASLATARRTR
ncbi:MAG: hypothetical protein AAFV29_06730, partial [Myxococcota bacterium]